MTTNDKIGQVLNKRVKDFVGVFNYNDLDKLPRLSGKVFIVNYVTDQEAINGKVGHYCVIDLRKDKVKGNHVPGNFFFDPYGLPPDVPRVILGLPNTLNVSRYLERVGGGGAAYNVVTHNPLASSGSGVTVNRTDFQSVKPWDNLCGVYAMLYAENPDFNKNPVFSTSESRVRLDSELQHIFTKLNVLGNSYNVKPNVFSELTKLTA